MSEQIRVFKKNFVDLTRTNVVVTATDTVATNNGQDFVDYMRNRKNSSAWITTGSTDAANTSIVFDMIDTISIENIIIIGHNLKAFSVEYWDGSSWDDFSTPINETTNTEESSFYKNDAVLTSKVRITITATMVADADKYIKQFIVTSPLESGQFEGWPVIKKPAQNTGKQITKMLSGKSNVVESEGAFECSLSVSNWTVENDLKLVEAIYTNNGGVLIWLSGGDESQFSKGVRIGYRKDDLYLMRPVDSYTPELKDGVYSSGYVINIKLSEVVN